MGKRAEGYLTTLSFAETIPRAQYVNETLVWSISGHWWNDGRKNRRTVEGNRSLCRLPYTDPTQSDLGSNPVVFAVNEVVLGHIFLRALPLFPVKIIPPMLHAHWTYVTVYYAVKIGCNKTRRGLMSYTIAVISYTERGTLLCDNFFSFLSAIYASVCWCFLSLTESLLQLRRPLFNLLKTKRNLLYIRNQSVPRSKYFPPRL